jgi:hypothetical protein
MGRYYFPILVLFILTFSITCWSQVGINRDTPSNGALLDIHSDSKGLLIPRVELTDNTVYAPITPTSNPTTGLLIYNLNTNSPDVNDPSKSVTPGFYYWSGTKWRRFFNQGYELYFIQSEEVRATTGNNVPIPDLDTDAFEVPFNGVYQIIVNAYYANGENTDSGGTIYDGAAQGAIILQWDPNNNDNFEDLRQAYVTSSSKYVVGGTSGYINHLAQNVTIVYNIDLEAGVTYQFRVVGNQWQTNNSQNGWFGKDTGDTIDYPGSTSNDAQRSTMSITLVRQY